MKEKSLEKLGALRFVVSRLLFAATPTKWTRTALPLHAQHARACWLHIGVLVRTNGGAGRSAGMQKGWGRPVRESNPDLGRTVVV